MNNNFDRGDRAKRALENSGGYEPVENTLDLKIPRPDGTEADGHSGYPISDLIADLFHLTTRYSLDPSDMVREAWEQFGADIVEQAWENDEEWPSDTLQDSSNIPAANTVLELNGVPQEHFQGIYVKVGFISPSDPDHPANQEDK